MDRETLDYLLSSGKYLCFNPTDIDFQEVDDASEGKEAEQNQTDAEVGDLFDSPILKNSVFFKEVATDQRSGRLYTSTRFLMAFNMENPHDGGASFEVVPGKLDKFLTDYYGGIPIHLSDHDKCVLDVFNRTPTFDPFMLLAQRGYLEKFRSVGDQHFSVTTSTASEVRSIISIKARQLVQLAANAGIEREKINATVLEIEDAIWLTQPNSGTSRVFQDMGIPADQENAVLLAWKGISYYEHMLREFKSDYLNMLSWLGSDNSFPSDIGLLGSSSATDIREIRKRAKLILRSAYLKASDIMRDYHASYDNLVQHHDPKPFHTFLNNSPIHFEELGMCVGSFGHVNNAWKSMTNDGRYPRPKAHNLETFYRFICELIDLRETG